MGNVPLNNNGKKQMKKSFVTLLFFMTFFVDLASADPVAPQAQEFREWPAGMISIGMLYAPAPLLMERGEDYSDKMLDQVGWQTALEFRTLEYMTVGAQVSGLYDANKKGDGVSNLLEFGIRLGATFPFSERWAIRATVVGGLSSLKTAETYETRFWGFQGWAIAGIIYRLSHKFVLYADISGTVSRYDKTFEVYSSSPGSRGYMNPNIFRLHLGIGIAFCWDRVQWRPPPGGVQ
jgi:hypothetical protein